MAFGVVGIKSVKRNRIFDFTLVAGGTHITRALHTNAFRVT